MISSTGIESETVAVDVDVDNMKEIDVRDLSFIPRECPPKFGGRHSDYIDADKWHMVTDVGNQSQMYYPDPDYSSKYGRLMILGDQYRRGIRWSHCSTPGSCHHPTTNDSTVTKQMVDVGDFPFYVVDRHSYCNIRLPFFPPPRDAIMIHQNEDTVCDPANRVWYSCDWRTMVMRLPCTATLYRANYEETFDQWQSYPKPHEYIPENYSPVPSTWLAGADVRTLAYDELAIAYSKFPDAWGHFAVDLMPY